MQAVILAAGMGKRLGELTANNTKCMVAVNGVPLIDRLLNQLENLDRPQKLARIVIVIGYEGEKLRRHINELPLKTPIEYIENTVYSSTNNIYSLFLARTHLQEDDTLLFESDLIVEDAVIRRILDDPYPSLALVSKFESWMDGTVVTLDDDFNIKSFIPGSRFLHEETESYYKTVNIYKFSKEFSRTHYVPFLEAYSKALGNNEYYEQVLRVIALLDKPDIRALPLKDEAWYEIDDIQDLDIAESMFCPPAEKLHKLESRYGGYWRYPRILDFCYLVNPFFPNKRLMSELKANAEVLVRNYPSGMRINSLLAAKYFGIRQEYICVGNGAAELIKALMERLQGNVGVILPTFEEYPNRLTPDRLVAYETHERDFAYSAGDLMNYFADKGISHLLLVNPDNPSGNFIPLAELHQLCRWAQQRGIHLVIDESFVDFTIGTPGNTLLTNTTLESYPHLTVVKSISKSYGVPGLRLGVLATSDRELIAWLKKDVAIWNINSLAEFYMQIFGKYEKNYQHACRQFIHERERFMDRLRTIPFLRVLPSQANYFMCEVLPPFSPRALTEHLLEHNNILIKDCSRKKAMHGKPYIYIAVRSELENDRLIESLTNIESLISATAT